MGWETNNDINNSRFDKNIINYIYSIFHQHHSIRITIIAHSLTWYKIILHEGFDNYYCYKIAIVAAK